MKNVQKGFTLIELMIVVAIIAILAAIAIPQYQTYVIKSQFTRVMGETGDQKVTVEDCFNNNNLNNCLSTATSSDLTTTSASITLPLTVAKSTITSTFGNHANPVFTTAAATLTWTRNSSGAWTCASTGLSATQKAKYAPMSCQN